MEGCSLSRLANPFLKVMSEFEIDLNIVIGTVSQLQFETCYEPIDKNRAFFHYVIKNSLINDINICIRLQGDIEKKLVSSICDSSSSLLDKKCLSAVVLKEFVHNTQPTTNNPLKTISVRGIEGIFSETLNRKIEGCSAFLKFSTENLSEEEKIRNLTELVNIAKQQINHLNNKFDEFNDIDCDTVKDLTVFLNEVQRLEVVLMSTKNDIKNNFNCTEQSSFDKDISICKKENQSKLISFLINKESPFTSEDEDINKSKIRLTSQINNISNTINEWVRYLTVIMKLHNDLYKFCMDMNSILPQHFQAFFENSSCLIPDYYYKLYFETSICKWSQNKSSVEEILSMANSICAASQRGLSNVAVLKKTFKEFIEPELTVAISLTEKSLFLATNNSVSTEILIDNVPCFCAPFWPEAASGWVKRQRFWPNSHLVGSIKRNGFHIVPKSLPEGDENLEWRLSFSAAESVLSLHRTEKQNYIYFLFKSLFYRYVKTYTHEKSLPTYICKTVMMWACEQQPVSWWDETSPENGVLLLIRELIKGIQKKVIKHYFIEELNLLEHFSSSILILIELTLFDLENNFSENLENLLETMSTKINVVQAHLNEKYTTPFDISVSFVYKQNCLTKLKFLRLNMLKMFFYNYYFNNLCIYEEISRTKAEIKIQAQIVDLIQNVLLSRENEELRKLLIAQFSKLNDLHLRITSLDRTTSIFFSNIKSLILLSCTKCDSCGVSIRCSTKRYSCSACAPFGGFDLCIDCVNNRKDIFQWIQIHHDQLDDNKSNVNHEDNIEIPCNDSNKNKQTADQKSIQKNDRIFCDLFSHTKNITLVVPRFDIEKFNHFCLETKFGLAFRELKQQYNDRDDIFKQEIKNLSSAYVSQPVPFIENICTQFIEKFENNIHDHIPVINKCQFEKIHELYLKDCYSPRCAIKFYDPPPDITYWQSTLVLKHNCAENYFKISKCGVPLKVTHRLRHESPGEIIRTTDFFNNLASDDGNPFDASIKTCEYSSDILSDATEMLDKEFTKAVADLKNEEKLILNLNRLIYVFDQKEA